MIKKVALTVDLDKAKIIWPTVSNSKGHTHHFSDRVFVLPVYFF